MTNYDNLVNVIGNLEELVTAVSNFVEYIDSPDIGWGGVPEVPEMQELRSALAKVKNSATT